MPMYAFTLVNTVYLIGEALCYNAESVTGRKTRFSLKNSLIFFIGRRRNSSVSRKIEVPTRYIEDCCLCLFRVWLLATNRALECSCNKAHLEGTVLSVVRAGVAAFGEAAG